MENNPVKSSLKSNLDLWLNTWWGRLGILAGTIQIAILCASLIISLSGAPDLSLLSILASLPGAGMMAFAHPLSLLFFPYGLGYMIDPYFFTGNRGTFSIFLAYLIFFLPYLIYLSILIPAILINKRVVFFILYAILVIILIANVAGCAIMPKPTGSM